MSDLSILELKSALATFLDGSTKPFVAVMGATASGKTSLAVELALQFDGEVINADSRQIYQEMEIGNELTKPEEMQGVPHHLFGCIPLSEPMSVAQYQQEAFRLIEDIRSRGKLPIICGGTSLWIDAVVDNFQIPEGEPDMAYRKQLEEQSVEELLDQLKEVDPASHDQLKEQGNKRYIIRALEIYELTGKRKSEQAGKGPRLYDAYKVAPDRPREEIYNRINARTIVQVNGGMIPEVQALVDKYAEGRPQALLDLGWPGISSIGCKEVVPYLTGDIDKEELISTLQQHNRQYAKRQLSWLRKDPEIHWISMD